jgi:hypothetical protein
MVFDMWPIILLAIDAPFFIFSISMIVFIVVQIRRNNPEFNGGFYKLFIVMAVNDTLLYIQVKIPVTYVTSFHVTSVTSHHVTSRTFLCPVFTNYNIF